MLETVRAYASLQLTTAGERDEAMEGLVRYATAEAALAAEGLVGPAQADWLDRVREDLESYRAAMTWLIEQGRSVEASVVASGLVFFWVIRGHAAEGLGWYEQILNLPSVPTVVQSKALVGSAVMCYMLGDLRRARTSLVRALAFDLGASDPLAMAQGEDLLGHVEHAEGHADAAREHFRRAIAAFKAVPNPWGIGHALSGLAWVALAAGDAAEAESLLDQAASVLHDAGPFFSSLGRYVRASLAVRRGQAEAAIAIARESLTRSRQLHDRFAFVYTRSRSLQPRF